MTNSRPERDKLENSMPMQVIIEQLIEQTRETVETFITEQKVLLENIPMKRRVDLPRHYHSHFSYAGPNAHLHAVETLTSHSSAGSLCAAFPALRDMFSLFPRSPHFKKFLAQILEAYSPEATKRFRDDCAGKRVVLHTSCLHRLDETRECIASFDGMSDDNIHHIVVLGAKDALPEDALPLAMDYDGLYLRVPAADTYEHLHRKLFYAYMLFDLLTEPEMVIKIDDNLILDDGDAFHGLLDHVRDEKAAYAGRRLGAPRHDLQWHGWHIDKCADPDIDTRGYQYPLPRDYAGGGFGYILAPEGLAACSYMYLAMKAFFDLPSVGLEDAYVGHAAYASQIELLDVAVRPAFLTLTGLTTKERQKLGDID